MELSGQRKIPVELREKSLTERRLVKKKPTEEQRLRSFKLQSVVVWVCCPLA